MGDILDATPHEALDRRNDIARVVRLLGLSFVAHNCTTIFVIAHHRRKQWTAQFIADHIGETTANRSHQRVRGAQIDSDR